MQALNLKIFLLFLLIFSIDAKTLKVDTVKPSVTNGDFTIQRDGTGGIVIGDYSGVLKSSSGTLSASNVDLTSEISGILPIASGGTNSSAALTNGKLMRSNGGAIVESGATIDNLSNVSGLNNLTVGNDGNIGNDLSVTNDAVIGNALSVIGTTTLNALLNGPLRASSGVVSTGDTSLASEVTGVLPVANGGTNSSTALANDKVMYSQGGAVVESGLTLDPSSNLSGIANLTATGTTTLNTSLTGVVKATSGVISTSDVNLTSEVTGVLPKANGGVPTDGTDGQVLTWDTGTYSWADNAGGGGAGGRVENYLTDYDFEENDVSGWVNTNAAYDISIESVTPLRKLYSGEIIASTAASGYTIDTPTFTLDEIDNFQILTLIFDVKVDSNYQDDDTEVLLRTGAGTDIKALNDLGFIKAGQRKVIAQYQIPDETASFRVRFENKRASATYSLLIDNVEFKNQDFIFGDDVGVASFRVIQTLDQTLNHNTAVRIGSSTVETDTHNGWDDVNKEYVIPISGYWAFATSGNTDQDADQDITLAETKIIRDSDSKVIAFDRRDATSRRANFIASTVGGNYFEKGDKVYPTFRQQNSDADSNVLRGGVGDADSTYFEGILISADDKNSLGGSLLENVEYTGNSSTALTASVTDIDFFTQVEDTLGSWDGSGYIANKAQTVELKGSTSFTTATTTSINLWKDGVFQKTVNTNFASSTVQPFNGQITLQKGERFSLRTNTNLTLNNNSNLHFIWINAKPITSNGIHPNQVKYYAAYSSNTSQTVDNGNFLKWVSKVEATHPWYDTSSGDLTPDRSLKLRIEISGFINAVSHASGDYFLIRLRRNGVNETIICTEVGQAAATYGFPLGCSVTINVNANDVIDFLTEENVTPAMNLSSDAQINYIIFSEAL